MSVSKIGCGRLARPAAAMLFLASGACSGPSAVADGDFRLTTTDRQLETAWWERVSVETVADQPQEAEEIWIEVKVPASILFEFDSAEIGPTGRATLERVIEQYGLRRARHLVVAGATDSTGDYDYNLDLSRRRAEAAVAELVQAGLIAVTIDIEAWADQHPVPIPAGLDREAADSLQRRVEIHALLPITVVDERKPNTSELGLIKPAPERGTNA